MSNSGRIIQSLNRKYTDSAKDPDSFKHKTRDCPYEWVMNHLLKDSFKDTDSLKKWL